MGLEPSFAEAWIHRSARGSDERDPWSGHVVLGRQLRPFCLWHLLLLQQIESPLLCPVNAGEMVGRVSPADLARAVAICRCRYGETNFGGGFSLRTFFALVRRGFGREMEAFRDYIGDFQAHPEFSIIPSENGGGRAVERGQPPELLRVVADVIAIARCSRREAWEMPEGEARWWYAMALRAKGVDCDFMTAEERTRQRQIADEAPELAAQLRVAAEQFRARRNQPDDLSHG